MSVLDELPGPPTPEQEASYRAAWPSPDLLAAAVPLAADSRVLLLGGAADPLCLALAARAPRGACVVADDDAAAGAALADAARRAGLSHLRAVDPLALALAHDGGAGETFDLAVANVPHHSSKRMTLALLALGRALLAPGGALYAAGARAGGIISIAGALRDLFGNVSTLAMRQGHRVVMAVRDPERATGADATPGESIAPLFEPEDAVEEVTLCGRGLLLARAPLVFAEGRLDPAAALLAEALALDPADTVVDLGCGAGAVGLVAARLAPAGHAYLIDSSFAAVRLAAANARRNAIANVTARAGDGPALLRALGAPPRVIATNPPHHAGQQSTPLIARRFIAESAACLAPAGRLYLVANRFLPYEADLRAVFGRVGEVAGDARYKVLLAEEAGAGQSVQAPAGEPPRRPHRRRRRR
jgi:16S rRNA (guanine1207-N2)-methyltransferase